MLMWQLSLVMQGYGKRVVQDLRNTRIIAYNIVMVNRDPDKPFPPIERFMPLPGDANVEYEDRKAKEKRIRKALKEKGLI